MKEILAAFVFCFLTGECFSQAGEWVWIKGDSVPNLPGNYGVQGVPNPTNNPPGLYEACEWTDLNENFWLFGGVDILNNMQNDLWKYDPINNEWTWIKGSGIPNDLGNYGIQGVPSLTNNPPARSYGVDSWVDTSGNFWMFGGASLSGYLNDLWKYDVQTNEWTWMKGSNIANQQGIYGTQGVPASVNNPRCRTESATTWVSNPGNLWLFGGFGGNLFGAFNDLWRYNVSLNEWTWMKGDSTGNEPGMHGTQGHEGSNHKPPGQWSWCKWKDSSGKFWLLGGGSPGSTNMLWRFNPVTNKWAWMSGGSFYSAHNGTKCLSDIANYPQWRLENRAAWNDMNGNFWLFGGGGFNDLWMYCVTSGQWTWISGDSAATQIGNWGTIGISSPLNKPNGRSGSVSWKGVNNGLYFFGGQSFTGRYNDIWKYTIDTTCGVCPTSTGIQENNPVNQLQIFPNPANTTLTISFQSATKQNIELRIYNTLGKQIYVEKEEITKGKFEKEINVEKWSGGIYFLQVKTKDGNISRKIIVKHP